MSIVELEGLPWKTNEEEIRKFLKNCKISNIVIILNGHGKPTGQARVHLHSEHDLKKAVKYHKQIIGNRYILVRQVYSMVEMRKQDARKECLHVEKIGLFLVKLGGLPWKATKICISSFLESCNILGGLEGITIELNDWKKPSGTAYVELETEEDIEKALSYDKKYLKGRIITVNNYSFETKNGSESSEENQRKTSKKYKTDVTLLEYLQSSLAEKEKDLECPVCLEPATAPIYMCGEMHMICLTCKPRLSQCPQCRSKVGFRGEVRRHRYAEKIAQEVERIKQQRDKILH